MKTQIKPAEVRFGTIVGVTRHTIFVSTVPDNGQSALVFQRNNIRRIVFVETIPVFLSGIVKNPVPNDEIAFIEEGGLWGFKEFYLKAHLSACKDSPRIDDLPQGNALTLAVMAMGRTRVARFREKFPHSLLASPQSAPPTA